MFGLRWMLRFRFHVFLFFFFLCMNSKLAWVHCSPLFTHCLHIKNGSHDTIYTFKNYFAIVLSVFSFSNNKLNPNGPIMLYLYIWFFFLVCNLTYIKLIYERVYLPSMHLCFGLWCLSDFVMFYLSFFFFW